MAKKTDIDIFEVGPRDGLQNEKSILTLEDKQKFIVGLVQAGLRRIEIGSFVRPDFVPQMADTDLLYSHDFPNKYKTLRNIEIWSLVPNLVGLGRAQEVGAKNIALFTAVTEKFAQKNIGMSLKKSLEVFKEVIPLARKNKMKVRAYISTAFGCPYEGKVNSKKTLKMIERVLKAGVDEVSVGDTIGVADPLSIEKVFKPAFKNFKKKTLALHCHDTRGTALANVLKGYECGVRIFDSSAGGLGGCPYAPGASGNLATEDLVYMMEKMGVRTGVDIDLLCETSHWLSTVMKKPFPSKVLQAYLHSNSKNKKWLK